MNVRDDPILRSVFSRCYAAAAGVIFFLILTGIGWLPAGRAAEPADPGILFLRLRREGDGAGFALAEAVRTPGRLKDAGTTLRRGIRFEFRNSNGEVLGSGVVSEEVFQTSLEHEDAARPGVLVRQPLANERDDFTVRLPFQSGASRVILRKLSGATNRPGDVDDEFIGDFALDSVRPEAPPRVGLNALNQPIFKQIVNNGPNANRINIVVLSEGYQAAQLSRFETDAKRVTDYLLNTAPWAEYKSYCNVFLIEVPSVDAGSDHPLTRVFKDTYFNSSFDSYSIGRLLTIPPNDWNNDYNAGAGKVQALLRTYLPEYDLALMVVNDATYGGSGGSPAIASVHTSSAEIVVHEVGHSFAGLGDEYDDAYPGYPDTEEPNTTKETARASIKWKSWILDSTPIPTPETNPFAGVIGLFEGAHFHTAGWYRPKLNCRMNSLGVAFCEVCAEAHVLKIYRLIEPVDAFTPEASLVTFTAGTSVSFEASLLKPATHSLQVSWTLDDKPLSPPDSTRLILKASDMASGDHALVMTVGDKTILVRNDSAGLLNRTRKWTLRVEAIQEVALKGRVRYQDTGQFVPGTVVNLTGGRQASIVAGLDGGFSVSVPHVGSFMLNASGAGDSSPSRGITELDIAAIRSHILGKTPLNSPYKILAADVNGSHSLSTLDLVLIRRVIAGKATSYPGGLWRFVPSNAAISNSGAPWNWDSGWTVTNPVADQAGLDFIGIKLGDADASWSPPGGSVE